MRRFSALISLVSMLGLGVAGAMAQDSNAPGTAPATQPPAETTPTETKPAETKPTDSKPADSKSPAKQPAKPAVKPAPKPSTQPATQPTPPSAPARPAIKSVEVSVSEPGPYVKREKPKDWVMTIDVNVRSQLAERRASNDNRPIENKLFKFETLSVVFPFLPATASASPERGTIKTMLRLQDTVVTPPAMTILDRQITGQPYQSGVSLIRMDAVNGECREVRFQVSFKSVAHNTVYDEAAASKVAWPKNGWPTIVASTFNPQMFIDYSMLRDKESGVVRRDFDTKPLLDWINAETKGNPASVPPATLAKWLAGQLMARLQPSGDGLTFIRTGELQGIGVIGPEQTFRSGRGSDFDIAATLVAAYRLAGLPARLVIGWDTGTGSGSSDNFLDERKGSGKKTLKVWVEWALYDEARATLNWVPVDLVKMRKQGSRPQPIDKPWKYFGTHDELQGVVPIAFHFHPPTTVESFGSPAMWGWMMSPDPPEVGYQGITFRADRASQTAEEQKKKREDGKK